MSDGDAERQSERIRPRLADLRRQIHKLQEDLDELSSMVADLTSEQHGLPRAPTAADVQRIIKARRLRDSCFGPGVFADPAWDILLHLYAAKFTGEERTVSFLCSNAGVAWSTAIRRVDQLHRNGWVVRNRDESDRRRVFVDLSERGFSTMQKFFVAVGRPVPGT